MQEEPKVSKEIRATMAGQIRAQIYSAVSTTPPKRLVSTVPKNKPDGRVSLAKALSPYNKK